MTPDRWLAVGCLAFAAFVIAAIPSQTSDRPIPGARGFDLLTGAFFPKLAVALFVLASLWLIVETIVRARRKVHGAPPAGAGAQAPEEPPGLTLRDFLYALGLTAGVLIYVQVLGYMGYLASTIPAVAILAWICGQRSWRGFFFGAVVFTLVVYFSFAHLFMVPLPRAQFW
jgi:hypothetical protein